MNDIVQESDVDLDLPAQAAPSNSFDELSKECAGRTTWPSTVIPGVEVIWEEIENAYSQEDRYFHSMRHVWEVVAMHKVATSEGLFDAIEEALLALVFHDIVYEPGISLDHELISSKLGRIITRALSADYDCGLVERNILATTDRLWLRHLKRTPSKDECVIVDCDNAIWGSGEDRYDAYSNDLEQELLGDGSTRYVYSRRSWLLDRLKAPRLYLTDFFQDTLGRAAKENMTRELESITKRIRDLDA
jgi:predicted metal-dependent HD superfamily phosphohydrolase